MTGGIGLGHNCSCTSGVWVRCGSGFLHSGPPFCRCLPLPLDPARPSEKDPGSCWELKITLEAKVDSGFQPGHLSWKRGSWGRSQHIVSVRDTSWTATCSPLVGTEISSVGCDDSTPAKKRGVGKEGNRVPTVENIRGHHW